MKYEKNIPNYPEMSLTLQQKDEQVLHSGNPTYINTLTNFIFL